MASVSKGSVMSLVAKLDTQSSDNNRRPSSASMNNTKGHSVNRLSTSNHERTPTLGAKREVKTPENRRSSTGTSSNLNIVGEENSLNQLSTSTQDDDGDESTGVRSQRRSFMRRSSRANADKPPMPSKSENSEAKKAPMVVTSSSGRNDKPPLASKCDGSDAKNLPTSPSKVKRVTASKSVASDAKNIEMSPSASNDKRNSASKSANNNPKVEMSPSASTDKRGTSKSVGSDSEKTAKIEMSPSASNDIHTTASKSIGSATKKKIIKDDDSVVSESALSRVLQTPSNFMRKVFKKDSKSSLAAPDLSEIGKLDSFLKNPPKATMTPNLNRSYGTINYDIDNDENTFVADDESTWWENNSVTSAKPANGKVENIPKRRSSKVKPSSLVAVSELETSTGRGDSKEIQVTDSNDHTNTPKQEEIDEPEVSDKKIKKIKKEKKSTSKGTQRIAIKVTGGDLDLSSLEATGNTEQAEKLKEAFEKWKQVQASKKEGNSEEGNKSRPGRSRSLSRHRAHSSGTSGSCSDDDEKADNEIVVSNNECNDNRSADKDVEVSTKGRRSRGRSVGTRSKGDEEKTDGKSSGESQRSRGRSVGNRSKGDEEKNDGKSSDDNQRSRGRSVGTRSKAGDENTDRKSSGESQRSRGRSVGTRSKGDDVKADEKSSDESQKSRGRSVGTRSKGDDEKAEGRPVGRGSREDITSSGNDSNVDEKQSKRRSKSVSTGLRRSSGSTAEKTQESTDAPSAPTQGSSVVNVQNRIASSASESKDARRRSQSLGRPARSSDRDNKDRPQDESSNRNPKSKDVSRSDGDNEKRRSRSVVRKSDTQQASTDSDSIEQESPETKSKTSSGGRRSRSTTRRRVSNDSDTPRRRQSNEKSNEGDQQESGSENCDEIKIPASKIDDVSNESKIKTRSKSVGRGRQSDSDGTRVRSRSIGRVRRPEEITDDRVKELSKAIPWESFLEAEKTRPS